MAGLVPYGYEKADQFHDLTIYKNQYTLPIGYTYDSCLSRDDYDQLSATEKAEAMMQGVLLEQDAPALKTVDPVFTSAQTDFQILQPEDTNVYSTEDGFVAMINDCSVKLQVDGIANTETILNLEQLAFAGTSRLTLYNHDTRIDPKDQYTPETLRSLDALRRHELEWDDRIYNEPDELKVKIKAVREDGSSVTRMLQFGTPYYKWYAGRKNYNVNFGYSESPVKEVVIYFPNRGIYSYDRIGFTCQAMSNYEEQAKKLAQNVLEDPLFEEDTFTGRIHLDDPKLLCLAIPYEKGWTAYVDGERAELLQANIAYMGLILQPGDHEIRLVYKTPLLRIGALVSTAGWIVYIMICCVYFVQKRKNRPSSGS
jgi:hypothetical protein